MNRKGKDLEMAAACLFFFLLSLAGLIAVFASGELAGVDGLLMLLVCAGMALLFAWLAFSAVMDSGLLGARHSAEPEPAAASAAAAAPAPKPAPSASAPAAAPKPEAK